MDQTHVNMLMVDYHIRMIRHLVDRMVALSDSEVANILSRLDVFEEEYRRQSDYLRPKPEKE
jgi:ABC-type dipeptide/oligopeptide/nickel transport system ATPase subunit